MRYEGHSQSIMPKLYLLAGATASGKTALSIEFAQQHNCEILSCDASCFYKGMDIGTAKPTIEEQNKVKHWGIDIVAPHEYFSIKNYIDYAYKCVNDILNRGHNVLVVGGSGFYLKSFLIPVTDDVVISKEIEQKLSKMEQEGGLNSLVEHLKRLNPAQDLDIDLKNPQKVKKALARCWASGKTLHDLKDVLHNKEVPFPNLIKKTFLLQRPLEILRLRIRQRAKKMLNNGLLDEVKNLIRTGQLIPNTPAACAIGYQESIQYLAGKISLQQLHELIVQNTYALVKKQMTWFRHQIHFHHYLYPH